MNEWTELKPQKPAGSKLEVQSDPVSPEAAFTTSGTITSIQARTLREVALLEQELAEADIVALVPDMPSEPSSKQCLQDIFLRVQVSAKALEADKELSESLCFRYDTHCARQRLPLALKIIAFCLPVLGLFGFFMFMVETGRFTNQGFARKVVQWKRWFVLGLVVWGAAVFIVIRLFI